jgi:hypothetical protein
LQSQIDKKQLHGFEIRPKKFMQIGEDKILGSAEWFEEGMGRQERYVVLTVADGKIADMQVCGSRREAKRFARRDLVQT